MPYQSSVSWVIVAMGRKPGQGAPQPITGTHVGCVQLPRLAAEKTLAEILRVPQVDVTDLWPFDAHNAEKTPAGTSKQAPSRGATVTSVILRGSTRTCW